MTRILAATDGSKGADRAVDHATALAKTLKAELLIVNITGGIPAPLFRRLTPKENAWLRETEEAASAEILKAAGERARSRGCRKVQLEAGSGDAVDAIIKIAKTENVDLIVVGKRGAGRMKGLLIGSVSQKLVSLAPQPVTVVP